jgi:peptidoglycan/LPS O-acetylase OafA/YrhL
MTAGTPTQRGAAAGTAGRRAMTVTAPRKSYTGPELIAVCTAKEQPTVPIPAHRLRLRTLDGVRGLAILSVMVVHFVTPIQVTPEAVHRLMSLHLWQLWRLPYAGWAGVDLFFVLSGFLITGILIDSKGSPGYFRRFYLRRALRIFPLYYGILALVFGVLPFFEPPSAMSAWIRAHQLWYWLYGENLLHALTHRNPITTWYELPHLWSLAVEEHFYLCWPLVVFGFTRRGIVRAALGLIALSFACRVLLYPWVGAPGVAALTPCRLDGLLAGALLALGWRDEGAQRTLRRWSRPALAASLVILAVIFRDRGFAPYDRFTQLYGFPLITLACGAFVSEAVACRPQGALGRALGGRLLGFLGRYSYGLYLFHLLLRPLFKRFLHQLAARGMAYPLACTLYLALSFTASILIAVVSYHAYEQRFLQLKERWAGA